MGAYNPAGAAPCHCTEELGADAGTGGYAEGGRAYSGGILRSSSGRSPPKARMAAVSCASSGSSMLLGSMSEAFFCGGGLGAVGLGGAFFWSSLRSLNSEG